jgi:hypothetical protein
MAPAAMLGLFCFWAEILQSNFAGLLAEALAKSNATDCAAAPILR